MDIKTLTVSQVNNYLKRIVDNDFILSNLSVKGEISNLTYHSSGHIYFSIKDDGGKLSCVMFKGKALGLKCKLKEGMSIIIKGRLSIYPATGSVQLYCDEIEEEGIGRLYVEYEKLKSKLNSLGYFSDEHKKEIPKMPERVGVVTSSTGAVFHDIINVSRKRNSFIDIILYPAKVQGDEAYKEIIRGIEYFNYTNSVDVIIIGRGGGSIEELWNFNEEELAMAIYNSKLPIISAVGHEVDFTISDFVSDLRAATPSQAAEFAVPASQDILGSIEYAKSSMDRIITDLLNNERSNLKSLERILNLNSPMARIVNNYEQIGKLKQRLQLNIYNKLNIEKQRLFGLNNILLAHNPTNVLLKGYAIIEDNDGVISSRKQLSVQKEIKIILQDGKIEGSFNPKI